MIPGRLRLAHSARTLRATAHNGPGWRIGFWVQGCGLLCTERCLNPGFLAPDGGYLYPPDEVAAAVLRVAESSARSVEGLTVLGGEPTEQAGALVPVLDAVRAAGLSTMVYTGYTLAVLKRSRERAVIALLASTDLLVDGPFIPKLYDESLAWRGSRNQKIHCLSDRYDEDALYAAFQRQGKGFSISVGPDDVMSVSGLQERAGAAVIEAELLTPTIYGGTRRHG